jgi:hypothetical protein
MTIPTDTSITSMPWQTWEPITTNWSPWIGWPPKSRQAELSPRYRRPRAAWPDYRPYKYANISKELRLQIWETRIWIWQYLPFKCLSPDRSKKAKLLRSWLSVSGIDGSCNARKTSRLGRSMRDCKRSTDYSRKEYCRAWAALTWEKASTIKSPSSKA